MKGLIALCCLFASFSSFATEGVLTLRCETNLLLQKIVHRSVRTKDEKFTFSTDKAYQDKGQNVIDIVVTKENEIYFENKNKPQEVVYFASIKDAYRKIDLFEIDCESSSPSDFFSMELAIKIDNSFKVTRTRTSKFRCEKASVLSRMSLLKNYWDMKASYREELSSKGKTISYPVINIESPFNSEEECLIATK